MRLTRTEEKTMQAIRIIIASSIAMLPAG